MTANDGEGIRNLRRRIIDDVETDSSAAGGQEQGSSKNVSKTDWKNATGVGDLTSNANDYDSADAADLDHVASQIGQDSRSVGTNALNSALIWLPQRWRNMVIRFIFTWMMIGGFMLVVYMGAFALMILVLIVQVKCFSEIINIGYAVYRVHNLPWFRSLSWYFLITSNYFFYGESLVDYFGLLINNTTFLSVLVRYHRFLSFSMYCIGFVWFVLSLVKRYYIRQFSLFAWTHVALLIVVTQSYLIIQNMFQGLIWFFMPILMVVINDIMAYMFGFFMGKTPLIKLSPKKTWEGYLGGGVATVVMTLILSDALSNFEYFTCPIEFNERLGQVSHLACETPSSFVPQEYRLPEALVVLRKMLHLKESVTVRPFLLHALLMSIFASIIGPFGGFFASGFKRAFKIKDFGDIIPGHGGIMDRFDCQFLMATFVNVYIHSFIRHPSPQRLLQQVFTLKPEDQLNLYYYLQDSLKQRGILTK